MLGRVSYAMAAANLIRKQQTGSVTGFCIAAGFLDLLSDSRPAAPAAAAFLASGRFTCCMQCHQARPIELIPGHVPSLLTCHSGCCLQGGDKPAEAAGAKAAQDAGVSSSGEGISGKGTCGDGAGGDGNGAKHAKAAAGKNADSPAAVALDADAAVSAASTDNAPVDIPRADSTNLVTGAGTPKVADPADAAAAGDAAAKA